MGLNVDTQAACQEVSAGYNAKNGFGNSVFNYATKARFCNNNNRATTEFIDGWNQGNGWGWSYKGRSNSWAESYDDNQNSKSGSAGKYYNFLEPV